jgi:hypothetical protein
MRIAVQPARNTMAQRALPPSPFAFYAEKDVLRLWLRFLNILMASYGVAMVALFKSDTACSGAAASLHCDPRVGNTRFAALLRTTHTAVAVYFGFSAWQLQAPRRCFVVVNAAALSMWGMAMLALGISQCVGAAQSGDPTAALLVGIELMVLGLAVAVGGGYGGWVYHKRRLAEILVVVDVLWATQQ